MHRINHTNRKKNILQNLTPSDVMYSPLKRLADVVFRITTQLEKVITDKNMNIEI